MKKKILCAIWVLVFMNLLSTAVVASFVAVGGGAGGDAEGANVTIEAGAVDVDLGDYECFVSVGMPFILHNDDIPSKTVATPSPHNQYQSLGTKIENAEFGLFGKFGFELFNWEVYLSAIGGFTRATEIELVQSVRNPQYYYEQSSENKTYGLYGGSIGYFPTNFDWPLCLQIDWDTRRGVTGMVGWSW